MTPSAARSVLSGENRQLDDDLLPRRDVPAGGVGGQDRVREAVAVGVDEPLFADLAHGADEAGIGPLHDLKDVALVHVAAVADALGDDLGAHDVAGHRPAVAAGRNEQILVALGVAGDDEAEALAVVAVDADEFVGGGAAAADEDGPLGPDDDAAVVHQVAQGVAEAAVVFALDEVQRLGELARPLRLVALGGELLEDLLAQDVFVRH